MTEAQREALARRINNTTVEIKINHAPFDLPEDYIFVAYNDMINGKRHLFVCGIDADGRVSS